MLGPFHLIETAINRALQFDFRTPQRLESLQGKILSIEITDIKLRLWIHFVPEGLRFTQTDSSLKSEEVIVKGPTIGFLSLAYSKDPFSASRLGLSIEGDMIIAETIQKFFLDLQLDWEEILSQFMGDTIAHSFFTFLKKGQQQQKIVQENLRLALGDYLKQETQLLPSQPEVDDFLNGVDELTQAIERLQARLNLVEHRKIEDKEAKDRDSA